MVVPVAFLWVIQLVMINYVVSKITSLQNIFVELCDVPQDKLDNPKFKHKLHDTQVLKSLFDKDDIAGRTGMGYYPCYENVLMYLQYLDPRGLNMVLTPGKYACCMYWIHGSSCSRLLLGEKIKIGSKN